MITQNPQDFNRNLEGLRQLEQLCIVEFKVMCSTKLSWHFWVVFEQLCIARMSDVCYRLD